MWRETKLELSTFGKWALSGLFDAAFLAAWVWTQHIANTLVSKAELVGIDRWVFVAFQFLFAAATLIPVAIYIYKDIRIAWIRAQAAIHREEKRHSRNNRSSVSNADKNR